MIPSDFIATIAPDAVSDMHRSGVLASITIAQAALESGWGKYAPGNNLFGIKGSGQEFTTQEYVNGHFVTITDGFRVYDSWLGSIQDHSEFLVENSRYARYGFFDACQNKDYAQAAAALQLAGYATDPNYAEKLIAIIEAHGLSGYDYREEEPEMDWKETILQEAGEKGLIDPTQHNADDPAPKWFILKVVLNAIRYIKGE